MISLFIVAAPLLLFALAILLAQIVRLRLELWANQRVIAALEHVDAKPVRSTKSRVPELLAWSLLLLILWQLLTSLL
jgi:hypothetical protein